MEIQSAIIILMVLVTIVLLFKKKSNVTLILAISNVLIFVVMMVGNELGYRFPYADLGFSLPGVLNGENLWTIFTSMFVHSDIGHLLGNVIFLVVIGFALENRIGQYRTIVVYFAGGILANLVWAFFETSSFAVIIGASGAISALMGCMLVMYPKDKVLFPFPIITNIFPVWIPIIMWFGLQVFMFMFAASSGNSVAYSAHVGGFVAGMMFGMILKYTKVGESPTARIKVPTANISVLKDHCNTHSLVERYEYAINAKDAEQQNMWVDNILNEIRCPYCGGKMVRKCKMIECPECRRELK